MFASARGHRSRDVCAAGREGGPGQRARSGALDAGNGVGGVAAWAHADGDTRRLSGGPAALRRGSTQRRGGDGSAGAPASRSVRGAARAARRRARHVSATAPHVPLGGVCGQRAGAARQDARPGRAEAIVATAPTAAGRRRGYVRLVFPQWPLLCVPPGRRRTVAPGFCAAGRCSRSRSALARTMPCACGPACCCRQTASRSRTAGHTMPARATCGSRPCPPGRHGPSGKRAICRPSGRWRGRLMRANPRHHHRRHLPHRARAHRPADARLHASRGTGARGALRRHDVWRCPLGGVRPRAGTGAARHPSARRPDQAADHGGGAACQRHDAGVPAR